MKITTRMSTSVVRRLAVAIAVLSLLGAACSKATPEAASGGSHAPAAGSGASDSSGGGGSGSAICKQLTTAEVQPLMVDPISKVTVTAWNPSLVGTSDEGQQCIFAGGDSTDAIAVRVLGGSEATQAYQADVQSLDATAVPGIGDQAARDQSDGSTMVTSIAGDVYCSVTPDPDEIPGVATLEKAAGYSSDIGDVNYAAIAAAVGTLCNVIYGSGNTTPDLSSLTAAAASAGSPGASGPSGGGLPTDVSLPSDAASPSS